MTLSTEALAMLEEIIPYLRRIAHNIHRTSYPQAEPDDLLSEMVLCFLEKWGHCDSIRDNTPGYYSRCAAWAARHWARDTFTRIKDGKRIAREERLPEWYLDALL